ncbi:sensor domain-containing diguanylate cyclase [Desulfovibrio ferrophilus]|uniref:diguanylate cyclase n=1 Tax=Desulfovibrio ferrophilus TaxID=241368 RepID=A0A2Z6B3H7_9BACT|nr:diguanylate cyclase [Desulfovibrio ferrophilus]BBD10069.1 diguanylate cyclase [Desulfovibrio ferrophilus]
MQDGPFSILFVSPEAPGTSTLALKQWGGDIWNAGNTLEGLNILKNLLPDIAILDTALPSSGWEELAAMIKGREPDIPVILTGMTPNQQDLMTGMRAGADLFLELPLSGEQLEQEIFPLARRAAQIRSNRLRHSTAAAILDATPAPMLITDGNTVDYMNRPMMELADLNAQLTPRSCSEVEQAIPLVRLHAVDDQSTFTKWISVVMETPDCEHLVSVGGKKSCDRTFLLRTTPLAGLRNRHSLSFTDVTSIENEKRMYHRLATTDPLTGVCNRRKFMDELDTEISRAARYGNPLSLIMIDIDNFKNVNDTMGHQAGDVALVELACLLKDNIRSMDLLARYGGEEFALIIPETDLEGANCVASKLCSIVDSTQFAIVPDMTCSLGVSSFSKDDSVHSLIERADQALYKAKHLGKNQACKLEPVCNPAPTKVI